MTASLGLSMSVKDDLALTSFRKAAIVTHKVLKHCFVRLVEDALDQGKSIKHEEIAAQVDECCEDPSRINIKLPQGHYESCYFPIVQVRNRGVVFLSCVYDNHRVVATTTFDLAQQQIATCSPMISSSYH